MADAITKNRVKGTSPDVVREIRRLRIDGMTYQEIGETVGVDPSTAWNIVARKNRADVPDTQ